tara:strand:- start:235 stop:741 length:507 start_codon:yes stop_codon:yes gene_type:complete
MNKLFFISILVFLFACDDGDLQIETLDFDTVDLQMCSTVDITQNTILFKLNTDEALILNLAANTIKNEAGTIELNVTTSSTSKLIYRLFSATATKNYFCDAVPPAVPTVVNEIIASKGKVIITTTIGGTVDTPTYEHVITLDDITFETAEDQRITDLTINDFGTITTN